MAKDKEPQSIPPDKPANDAPSSERGVDRGSLEGAASLEEVAIRLAARKRYGWLGLGSFVFVLIAFAIWTSMPDEWKMNFLRGSGPQDKAQASAPEPGGVGDRLKILRFDLFGNRIITPSGTEKNFLIRYQLRVMNLGEVNTVLSGIRYVVDVAGETWEEDTTEDMGGGSLMKGILFSTYIEWNKKGPIQLPPRKPVDIVVGIELDTMNGKDTLELGPPPGASPNASGESGPIRWKLILTFPDDPPLETDWAYEGYLVRSTPNPT